MKKQNSSSIPLVRFSADVPLGFEITTLSNILGRKYEQDHPTRLHRTAFCALLHVDSGEGFHTVDFEKHRVRKGDLVFIGNGSTQQFTRKKNFDGILILFTERFLFRKASLSNSVLLNLLYPLSDVPAVMRTDGRLARGIHMLVEEWKEPEDPERADILRSLLDYVLLRVCRARNAGVAGIRSEQDVHGFAEFFRLIKKHHRESRNAKDYADMLGISYKHLNAICKQTSNRTAKQAIDQFVLIEAKRLLAVGDGSVEELSVALGFDETTNFIKYFKRYAGATPAQFRRRLRNDQVRN